MKLKILFKIKSLELININNYFLTITYMFQNFKIIKFFKNFLKNYFIIIIIFIFNQKL